MKHFFFGTADFHEGRQELRVDGTLVQARPRQLAVLSVLLHACGNLVSRNELLDGAWSVLAEVQPGAVDQSVSRLRRNLGENGRFIITRNRRGYQIQASSLRVEPIIHAAFRSEEERPRAA